MEIIIVILLCSQVCTRSEIFGKGTCDILIYDPLRQVEGHDNQS